MSRSRRRRKPADRGIVDIVDLASNARGVGHVDGKAVFVADTLPGERALYRPTKRKKDYEEASLETLFSASDKRVTPRCAHFGVCGGCALQHAGENAQIEFKQGQLMAALERVGKVAPNRVLEPLVDERWGYRRRARLGVKYVPKKGGTLVGFRERGAPFIALLKRCEVLVPSVGDHLTDLAALIDGLSIRERLPQIEVAAADNAVALVFRVLDAPTDADRQRLREFGARFDFSIYLQPGNEHDRAARRECAGAVLRPAGLRCAAVFPAQRFRPDPCRHQRAHDRSGAGTARRARTAPRARAVFRAGQLLDSAGAPGRARGHGRGRRRAGRACAR